MATKTRTVKKEKKFWYNILASKDFNQVVLGETVSRDRDGANLIGRTIWVNLANITNDVKMQNVKVRFKINEIKEKNAYTEIIGYELLSPYIKRVVKVERNKIDDSFLCKTKDNIKIKIKPLLLTRKKTNNSTLTMIRKTTREYFNQFCSRENYDKFIINLVNHRLQNDLRNSLKKIYPLNVVEIRVMSKI